MANELPVLLHTVNDIERVSDHALNIAEIAERKLEDRRSFSESAQREMTRMRMEVSHMFDNVLLAVDATDHDAARQALMHEEAINEMQVKFRHTHIRRLSEGACDALTGLIYIDFVNNMEKIGDHLTNVAQGVLGGLQWGAETQAAEEAAAPAQP